MIINEQWKQVAFRCPMCGRKIKGYKNSKGVVKSECYICNRTVYSIRKNNKRVKLTIE